MAVVAGGLALALVGIMLLMVPVGTGLLFVACMVDRRGVQVACVFSVTALVLVWSAAWAVG